MKLSIITINYNNHNGLKRTIESVINQTKIEFEYIIIDGDSIDGSKEIIQEYSTKIDYWVSERDGGIYNAMNKGIQVSKGEYLLFLNSGDVLFDLYVIENIINDLSNYDIISGCLKVINEGVKEFSWIPPKHLSFQYLFAGTICHPCTFIRRECFNIAGLYDESLKIVSDWKWFIIGLTNYNFSYKTLDVFISNFYLDGVSSMSNNYINIKTERDNTLKNYFPMLYNDYANYIKLISFKEDLDRSRLYNLFLKLRRLINYFKSLYGKNS